MLCEHLFIEELKVALGSVGWVDGWNGMDRWSKQG